MVRLTLLLAACIALTAAVAQADWYDWSGSPMEVVGSDPTGDLLTGSGDAKDITGYWWSRDESFDYFRLDLNGPISSSDFVNIYGIYLSDGNAGTGSPSSNLIVPGDSSYDGTDFAVTARYNDFGDIQYKILSVWNGGGWTETSVDGQYVSGPVAHLEWRVPIGTLPTDFWFSAGTLSLTGGGAPKTTYDVTGKSLTPEPGTWALLAMGIPAVVWFRRRKQS